MTIENGLCYCGCGGKTALASQNNKKRGWVKGQPVSYIRGHATGRRTDVHVLEDIDTKNRRAVCGLCGLVSIKREASAKSGWTCCRQLISEHRLVDVDEDTLTAHCLGCLGVTQIKRKTPTRWACTVAMAQQHRNDRVKHRDKRKAQIAEWQKKNPLANRNWKLRRQYGITHDDYESMFAKQNGKCSICGGDPDFHGRLVIDHNHITNEVRGLLCNRCNRVLGMTNENPKVLQSMVDYLCQYSADSSI